MHFFHKGFEGCVTPRSRVQGSGKIILTRGWEGGEYIPTKKWIGLVRDGQNMDFILKVEN